MSLSDYLVSVIRTGVPTLIGAGLAWLAAHYTFVGALLDSFSGDARLAFYGAVTTAVVTGYYALVRKVEQRWPVVGRLLGWKAAPTYTKG